MVKEIDKCSSKIYQYGSKNKGFTLIELLAVIAVIAILAIFIVPNVLKVVDKSKKNLFITQAKNIYNEAIHEYAIATEEYEEKNRFYYAGEVGEENKLELSGNDKVYYDIEIFSDEVVKFLISDENFCMDISDINIKLKDIDLNRLKVKREAECENFETSSKIYGVEFNLNTGIYTRTDDAVGMTFSNPATANTIDSDFNDAEIYKEMIEVTDSYGNKFIKIPKFYIKKTVNADNTIWKYQISKFKQDSSYYLPACFMNEETNSEIPYILVGKYNASLSVDGTKLESKSEKVSLVSKNITQFRDLAKANGTSYQLLDIHIIDVLQTLFYIEFATLDSSSIMYGYGAGQYSLTHTISAINGTTLTLPLGVASNYKTGQMIDIGTALGVRDIATNLRITAVSGNTITYEVIPGVSTIPGTIATSKIVYNVPYLTGLTDTVTTISGSKTDNTSGKYPMKYRGIESIYGNMWQLIDGININSLNGKAYVARNSKKYKANEFLEENGYTPVGYSCPLLVMVYAKKMGYDNANPFVQLPTETTILLISSKYKDTYIGPSGSVAMYGGGWSQIQNSGIANWRLEGNSITAFLDIGVRLVKTP